MKKRVYSILLTLALLISLVPCAVFASGDGDGLTIDDAIPVSTQGELEHALALTGDLFIEVVDDLALSGGISISSGKTVILRSRLNTVNYPIEIAHGATLINEGSIYSSGYYSDAPISVYGTLDNRSSIEAVHISCNSGGTFVNQAEGLVNRFSPIFAEGGTITNSGTIESYIYSIDGTTSTINGVETNRIRNTNARISYQDMTYTPINIPLNFEKTIGLPGDDSEWILDPLSYSVFAHGFRIHLLAGQTLSVQVVADTLEYLYLLNDSHNRLFDGMAGLDFTVAADGDYYLVVAGYSYASAGSLKIVVHEEPLRGDYDFTDDIEDIASDSWSWTAATKTLTLSGATIAGEILLPEGATIQLTEGTQNYVMKSIESYPYNFAPELTAAVGCRGDLTIQGSGDLLVTSDSYGIFPDGKLVVNGAGEIEVNASSTALSGVAGIDIINCASILAKAWDAAIFSSGSILIEDSSVKAIGKFGIMTSPFEDLLLDGVSVGYFGGDITIRSSHVIAETDSGGSAAIYAGDNLTEEDAEGHAQIILDGAVITQPAAGRIVDTNAYQSRKCQTITNIEGLDMVTDWSQASKRVVISPVYTVTFTDWDERVLSTQSVISGSAAAEPASPEREGYIFAGWNLAFDVVTSNLTIMALYTAAPTPVPTVSPTPTVAPTVAPTAAPTAAPTVAPTVAPTTGSGTIAKTGEATSNFMWLPVLLISVAAVCIIGVGTTQYRRRSKRK